MSLNRESRALWSIRGHRAKLRAGKPNAGKDKVQSQNQGAGKKKLRYRIKEAMEQLGNRDHGTAIKHQQSNSKGKNTIGKFFF